MTTQAPTATQARPPAAIRGASPRGNPWRPSLRGVLLAAWIELLRRRPSKKGYVVYAFVFAAIVALSIVAAVTAGPDKSSVPFELVLILVLGSGMLIGPSLSATSINGDSSEGVLAPLQMTRLTAADLAFGKLFASWVVCIAALLTTTPLLAYAYSRSGWRIGEAAAAVGVILFMVLACHGGGPCVVVNRRASCRFSFAHSPDDGLARARHAVVVRRSRCHSSARTCT